ncbi:MAG: hypothetical protein GF416_04370 [Candidatus Altiarchaeales archaeon]|nr:hypothetical protein [Candidatus Altiarchaeales archaeon]MBD3416355.1 hypothetical protein [Candidatus Altiarchaeales archaeon]
MESIGFCSKDKSNLVLYVCVEEQYEILLEKTLPEHITLFRRLIQGFGLSWEEACRLLREDGR